MKALLTICLSLCCLLSVNAGHHRVSCRRVPPRPRHVNLTWKQIAAGGAAAGTVVAAYKVSNGIENGFEKAAEKDPKGFLSIWAFFPHLLALVGIVALYKWIQNRNPGKEEK